MRQIDFEVIRHTLKTELPFGRGRTVQKIGPNLGNHGWCRGDYILNTAASTRMSS